MSDQEDIFWAAGFLDERFSAPVSPLGWSIIGAIFDRYALRDPLRFMGYPDWERIPATRLYHGHPYANVLIFQIIYNPFPDWLVPADAVRYFPGGDLSWRRRAPYPRSIFNPRLLLSLAAHLLADPINWSPLNFWWWDGYTHVHDRRAAELGRRLDLAAGPQEILAVAAGANRVHAAFASIHRWSLTYADIFYKLLAALAGESAQILLSDVPNMTSRLNSDLRQLGNLAAMLGLSLDSSESTRAALQNREFAAALAPVLGLHGHRSFSLDVAAPTFREEPDQFLQLLRKEPQRRQVDWRDTRDQVRRHLAFWKRPLFDLVLTLARRYATLREDQRYYWHKSLAVSRRAYLLLAGHLLAAGIIHSGEDIFCATAAEIASFFQDELSASALAEGIDRRRAAWVVYSDEFFKSPTRAYPAFLKGDTPLEKHMRAQGDTWRGRGVSPGQARGPARVILEAANLGHVAEGEILVAPATDPGWTPVFPRLAGLVLERGGVLAHGAIVAREYHLPAVAGITNITLEVADGDWIEVDGTRGTVRRLPS